MGICGFHQYTKHYLEQQHIRSYANKRVGIDASAWLHRGSVPYAWDIFNGTEPWKQHTGAQPPWVEFPMRLFHMLVSFDVHPVFVFDGCTSPAKAPTSLARRTKKEKAKQRALESVKMGNYSEAARLMQQAFDVTHDMAGDLIAELKSRGIEFVVAPYEADAQLAYLSRIPVENGGVNAVITEDSDLVAYGCTSILFKCSPEGWVQELRKERLFGPSEPILEAHLREENTQSRSKDTFVRFDDWTDDQMCLLCILSGCDFLPSLVGMGFKTAYALVKQGKTVEKTLAMMKTHARWSTLMTDEYADSVKKAFETFRYSLVYDKKLSKAVHLQDLPEHLCDQGYDHLGPPMDQDAIYKIAHGIINPSSKEEYQISTKNHGQWHEARQQPRNTEGIFAHVYSQTSSDNGRDETSKTSSLSLFFESYNKSKSTVTVSKGSSVVVHGTKRPSSSNPLTSRGKDFPKQTRTMKDFFGPKQAPKL